MKVWEGANHSYGSQDIKLPSVCPSLHPEHFAFDILKIITHINMIPVWCFLSVFEADQISRPHFQIV